MHLDSKYNDEFYLIQNLQEGDISAFRFIYKTHYRPLFHFANRLLKDDDQSEDIIAETFVTIWRKRQEFETYKGLVSFIYTCTRNACISYLRASKRHLNSHQEIRYLADKYEPFDSTESIKTTLVQCSIIESQNLPAAMKKVFQLLYIDGFTTTEIAEKLQISVHTVRAQKANAVKRIKETLLKKGLLSFLF